LCTSNTTRTALETNLVLRIEKPAINRLRNDTAAMDELKFKTVIFKTGRNNNREEDQV
jgi:hypothetical protein